MLLIFFLVAFNYNLLRNLKDAPLIMAKSSGVEVIPFVKVWGVLPGAVIMTFLFTLFCNRFSPRKAFYGITSIFLCFFVIFMLFLYPNKDALHFHSLADYLQTVLPSGCRGFIAMTRYWVLALFYVMAELWSSIVLSVLFWGFANEVTKLGEARRFYGLFGLIANFSAIAAPGIGIFFMRRSFNPALPFGASQWDQAMHSQLAIVIVVGLLIMALHYWMYRTVLIEHKCDAKEEVNAKGEKKPRMSLRETVAYLSKSPYALFLAVIVFTYSMSTTLLEVIQKHQVSVLYPSHSEYTIFMSKVNAWTGVVSIIIALFITGNSIKKLGWTKTALMTPIILLVTSIGLFVFFAGNTDIRHASAVFLGMTPLVIPTFILSFQNILGRAAKFTVFDVTKELAFVPLGRDVKIKTKAAIDGVGSRLGKSAGSVTHQIFLLFFTTLSASVPYVMIVLFLVIGCWIFATRALGKRFNSLVSAISENESSGQENEKAAIVLSEKEARKQAV